MIAILITFASLLVVALSISFFAGIGVEDSAPAKVSTDEEAELLSRDADDEE